MDGLNELAEVQRNNIQLLMELRHLTITDIAIKSGANRQTIANGFGPKPRGAPSQKTIRQLERGLGLRAGRLDRVGDDFPPPPEEKTESVNDHHAHQNENLPEIIKKVEIQLIVGTTRIQAEVDEVVAKTLLETLLIDIDV